jgi:hypothetical protein
MHGLEPESLEPVGDRAFMSSHAPADLGERQSLAQKLLEQRAIHAPIVLIACDGTRALPAAEARFSGQLGAPQRSTLARLR